jgi:hypothetical protein
LGGIRQELLEANDSGREDLKEFAHLYAEAFKGPREPRAARQQWLPGNPARSFGPWPTNRPSG